MRRLLRRLFGLGLVAGVGYAAWRYFEKQRGESRVDWEPQPFPYPPQPRETPAAAGGAATAPATTAPATTAEATTAWVEPTGETCPASHPVKAKMSSQIFHVPGGASYDRTRPDRCYRDAAAAEADGLRKAAR